MWQWHRTRALGLLLGLRSLALRLGRCAAPSLEIFSIGFIGLLPLVSKAAIKQISNLCDIPQMILQA